jgi:long-chain acyl-CoA synthetase
MIRPWTHFYPEGTSRDLPPIRWPHVPAFVRETSDKFRDHPAFTLYLPNGTQGTITYGEVDRLSDGLAVYLREMAGFGAGDRVAIQMPNCLAYPVAVFACLKAGLVMVNTNPLYTPAEMVHQFADSGSTGLIAVDLFATKVDQTLPKTKIRKVIVASLADLLPAATGLLVRVVQKYVRKMVPPISFAHVRFADAIREGAARIAAGADPSAYASALTPESPAALQYTGGTTGVAKGAVLTHGNLLANVAQSLEMWKPWLKEGREVMLTALPLYHIFAFTANLMIFYSVGGRNILIPSPRPPSNLRKVMTREPITWFTGVNTLFAALMQEPWFQEKKSWHLHGTVAGGMALVPAVGDRWEQMTRTPMYQGYGLTETSPVATLNPFHRPKRDSIGVPLPGTDVKIVDATGAEVPTGQPGELLIRGPQVMQEYWRRPDETAAVMKNGWFASGDIAVMDEDGYLAIVDRKKDLINVSGFNVYPNEVEAVLATHPGVVEMAVIGVSDEHTGEAVCAYVVRRNSSVTADMIRQHCRASLTNYKVPKHVIFREELPKSPVGKVLRKDLRELAMKGA